MEKNYKFKFNLEEPDSKAIRSRMDFDALLQQHEAEPVAPQAKRRTLVYVLSAAAAAIALLLVVPLFFQQDEILSPEAYFAEMPCVNPPVPQLEVPYQIKSLDDSHKGGIIEYPSGSRLVVPAAAFMNDYGSLVGGEVSIHYRELHDQVDFFAAGIPMQYDSLGVQRYLTAAGMIEIYAEQNGQRLQLADGKNIQVELVSTVPVTNYFTLPNYYVYKLDTLARKWTYQAVDILQFVENDDWLIADENDPARRWQQQLADLESNYEQDLQDLQYEFPLPAAPIKPTAANGNRPTLEFDFFNGEIALDPASDLQANDLEYLHDGTIWEVLPESPEVDPRAFRVTWESVRLRRLNAQRFELTLVHSQNEETMIVAPVLLGLDYDRAVSAYEIEQAAYDAAVTRREELIAERREALRADFAQGRAALQTDIMADMPASAQPLTREVVNRFVINSFGVWNCAQPVAAPAIVQGLRYFDQDGELLQNLTAYVLQPQQNTLYRYLANEKTPIGLPDGDNNWLWIVDEAGKIALTKLPTTEPADGELRLETISPSLQDREALRELLGM